MTLDSAIMVGCGLLGCGVVLWLSVKFFGWPSGLEDYLPWLDSGSDDGPDLDSGGDSD